MIIKPRRFNCVLFLSSFVRGRITFLCIVDVTSGEYVSNQKCNFLFAQMYDINIDSNESVHYQGQQGWKLY